MHNCIHPVPALRIKYLPVLPVRQSNVHFLATGSASIEGEYVHGAVSTVVDVPPSLQ